MTEPTVPTEAVMSQSNPQQQEEKGYKMEHVPTNIFTSGGHEGGLASALPLLLAGRADRDGFGGGGLGAGLVGGVIGSQLFGRRGGGWGGDGGSDGVSPAEAAIDAAILNNVNALTAAVPTTALQTQAAINSNIGALALGTQQGFANVKDSVQATAALNNAAISNVNQNVLVTGLQTQIAIGNDGDKTRALIESINNANLQRMLTVAQQELFDERGRSRSRDVEVNVSQVVNQAQAQAQQQAQFQGLHDLVRQCVGELQVARATNANLIIGSTGVATGQQNANPVNVR